MSVMIKLLFRTGVDIVKEPVLKSCDKERKRGLLKNLINS
jgi:hypothetical protein